MIQNVARKVLSYKAFAYYASASDDEISRFSIIITDHSFSFLLSQTAERCRILSFHFPPPSPPACREFGYVHHFAWDAISAAHNDLTGRPSSLGPPSRRSKSRPRSPSYGYYPNSLFQRLTLLPGDHEHLP